MPLRFRPVIPTLLALAAWLPAASVHPAAETLLVYGPPLPPPSPAPIFVSAEQATVFPDKARDASAATPGWLVGVAAAAAAGALVLALLAHRQHRRGAAMRVWLLAVAESDTPPPPPKLGHTWSAATDALSRRYADAQRFRDEVDEIERGLDAAAAGMLEAVEALAGHGPSHGADPDGVVPAFARVSAATAEVVQRASDAAASAERSGEAAANGVSVVDETVAGMQAIREAVAASSGSVAELGKRGEQIGQIIGVINDIADQTNLLALNAAIEAARAGEHGRGFAIVADEVRKLADRTTQATEEIAGSIRAIQSETAAAVQRMDAGTAQVAAGVERAGAAGESLRQIVGSAREVADLTRSITAAAEEQSAAAEEVARGLERATSAGPQTAERGRAAAARAAEWQEKTAQLRAACERFTR
ncbi:MAG: methyl-accepting chemotaxis protein [Planctomycetota bacterium]